MPSYEFFEKLPDEKKEKIIQASMEVFAEKGYVNASTNDIVKRAGISKGILFHYFGNKKNLYLYVLDKTQLIKESVVYMDILKKGIYGM